MHEDIRVPKRANFFYVICGFGATQDQSIYIEIIEDNNPHPSKSSPNEGLKTVMEDIAASCFLESSMYIVSTSM